MNNLVGTKKYTGNATGKLTRNSFAFAYPSGWDDVWQQVSLGSGMTNSQSAGNGVINTGVTTNSETIMRFRTPFTGDANLRARIFLSQRIVNQSFFFEAVDVIGEGAAVTVNSATSITVTMPSTFSLSAANVGQSMNIGAISGIAGAIPGRYVIASVSGQNANFTVAGWPASGTGTASLFGWNGYRITYDGATATSAKFDCFRNGYATGDTAITINTTATPGHVPSIYIEDGLVSISDSTTNALTFTSRGARTENVPDQIWPLYLQIRAVNGSTAPASTTALSCAYVSIDEFDSVNVSFGRQPGSQAVPAVQVTNTPAVTVSSGTVTTVTTAGTPAVPATPYFVNSAASTNGALILTGTSGLQAFYATNTGAAAAFVKLYNKATAPTVGTDVPEMIIPVPAAVGGVPGVAAPPIGFNGFRFALGLGIAITGGAADNDTTAVAAGQVKVKLSRTV
jgi:hypothetical protein